jgi:hypothetical protein
MVPVVPNVQDVPVVQPLPFDFASLCSGPALRSKRGVTNPDRGSRLGLDAISFIRGALAPAVRSPLAARDGKNAASSPGSLWIIEQGNSRTMEGNFGSNFFSRVWRSSGNQIAKTRKRQFNERKDFHETSKS